MLYAPAPCKFLEFHDFSEYQSFVSNDARGAMSMWRIDFVRSTCFTSLAYVAGSGSSVAALAA